MKKRLIVVAVASVVSGALTPTYAADDGPKVTTNGSLGFALNMQDSNESWEMKNTKVRFGTNVVQMTDYGKIIGQIEFDYDNASNDSNQADGSGSTSSSDGDEIDVRNARVIWATPSIGKFVFAGRSPSGQYGTNYSRVDIFDGGGYHYFQQGDHTGKLIGYVSPAFSGVQAGVALFATNPANDEDQDLQHFRVEWNSGPWHVGYGQVENKTLTSDDTTREAFSFGYADGPLAVGVTSENKWGGNDGDDVLGVAGSYSVGDHTFRAAVYSQSSDTDANDGLSATTLEYSLALNKYTNVFVTMDQWDVTDTTDDDATVLGINMKW